MDTFEPSDHLDTVRMYLQVSAILDGRDASGQWVR